MDEPAWRNVLSTPPTSGVCALVVAAALAGEAITPLQLTWVVLVLAGVWFGATTLSLEPPELAPWGRTSLMPVPAS